MTRIMGNSMTDDQFKRLLEQNNAALMERIESSNAAFFGQLSQHFDSRFDALHNELTTATDRIYTQLDGIAKRLDDDDKERAAMSAEQDRHSQWIGQLAEATHTKLVPEQ